jgi:hypothetical protein
MGNGSREPGTAHWNPSFQPLNSCLPSPQGREQNRTEHNIYSQHCRDLPLILADLLFGDLFITSFLDEVMKVRVGRLDDRSHAGELTQLLAKFMPPPFAS